MKIVAVSQRVDIYLNRDERRDALDQRLIDFLLIAGYLPVPVPNSLCRENAPGTMDRDAFDLWIEGIRIEAILISGGNDINTCYERDMTERRLLDYAFKNRHPVLGICRGMQMMGVLAGGELEKIADHVCTSHELIGVISGGVNSYHNLVLEGCPNGYNVLARSADGGIEAIQHRELPWEGWMWHPEREVVFNERDILRLKNLFG